MNFLVNTVFVMVAITEFWYACSKKPNFALLCSSQFSRGVSRGAADAAEEV